VIPLHVGVINKTEDHGLGGTEVDDTVEDERLSLGKT